MTTATLSPKQQELLDLVRSMIVEHGYAPTLDELGERMGITRRAIRDHLERLEAKGRIRREKGKVRAIQVLDRCAGRCDSDGPNGKECAA